jgi:capsular polysaccharide biosynthesis protein
VSEQPLDLKSFSRVVRRRRRMVGALAALGLAAGVAHWVLLPPVPTARALVVLPASTLTSSSAQAANPAQEMSTQVIIATSTPVLAEAGKAVSPPISPEALKRDVSVGAPGTDVLQFDVSAPRSSDAIKLTNAMAASYIAYVNKTGSGSESAALSGLQAEATTLTAQIKSLQQQINTVDGRLATESASSLAGQRDSALVSSLRTEQEQVSLQLNSVNSQIVNSQLSGAVAAGAITVLQSAAIVPASKVDLVLYVGGGAFLGAFIGCVVAVARSRRDQRLRLRDEIAGAIGLPVVASVESARCQTAKDWRRLLEEYTPSPVETWNLRRLFHGLVPAGVDKQAQLSVLVFAADAPALSAVAQLASTAARLGTQVALVAGDDPSLALLRAALQIRSSSGSPVDTFYFESESGGSEFSSLRLTISLVALGETKPDFALSGGANLLAVSAGFATAESLALAVLSASDAHHPIEGVIIVNPDPSDATVGLAPRTGDAPLVQYAPYRRAALERLAGQSK